MRQSRLCVGLRQHILRVIPYAEAANTLKTAEAAEWMVVESVTPLSAMPSTPSRAAMLWPPHAAPAMLATPPRLARPPVREAKSRLGERAGRPSGAN
jgi:hypothetical protein